MFELSGMADSGEEGREVGRRVMVEGMTPQHFSLTPKEWL